MSTDGIGSLGRRRDIMALAVKMSRERNSGSAFDSEDEASNETESDIVLEPASRRLPLQNLAVSTEMLADEAGQHIDLNG